jgi:hypothetical protein
MRILDARAGRAHGRSGSVASTLAEILTRYEELKAAERSGGDLDGLVEEHPRDLGDEPG